MRGLGSFAKPDSVPAIVRRIDEALRRLTEAQWVAQLLVRLFVGYFFFETGWGKIQTWKR